MRITMHRLALIAIIFIAGVARAEAQVATTRASEQTRRAVIEIRFPDHVVGFNKDKVIQRLRQRAVELAPDMIGLSEHELDAALELSPAWVGNDRLAQLEITVNLSNPKARPGALPLADALVEELRAYAKQHWEQMRDEYISGAEKHLAASRKAMEQATQNTTAIKQKIRTLSGRSDTSSIPDAVNKLEEERARLELDVLGKTARREALEKHLAEQTASIEEKVGDDQIANELEKVVEGRVAMLERIQQLVSKNAASMAEVKQAIGEVAEARAKVLERKRDAAIEAGGDALAALNRELLTLSIDLRELKARLEYIESRLPDLREALDLTDELRQATADAGAAHTEAEKAQTSLKQWQQQLAEPPEVAIVLRQARAEAETHPGALFSQ